MNDNQDLHRSRTVFPYWHNRLAPVFDTARHILIVDIFCDRIAQQTEKLSIMGHPSHTAQQLVALGVDTLVCGAISRPLNESIVAYGIEVIPFLAGDLQKIVRSWKQGRLSGDSFAMPGCRRRRGAPFGGPHEDPISGVGVPAKSGLGTGKGGRFRHGKGRVAYWRCSLCGEMIAYQYGGPGHEPRCTMCGTVMTGYKEKNLKEED